MQVSWIDPDQLRDLVGALQRPAGTANNLAWELHTLPNPAGLGAKELGIDDGDLWLPDQQSSLMAPAVPASEPAEEFFSPAIAVEDRQQDEEAAPPPQIDQPEQPKELNRIREKLQAIRERAIEAGLLAHVRVAEVTQPEAPTPPAAETSVSPPPVAETTLPEPPAPARPPSLEERLLPIESPFALAEPSASPAASPRDESNFEVPHGAISERLEAFAAWAERRLYLNDMLVVDDHGDILWGDHAQSGLVVSAMMACKATLRSSALGAAGLPGVIEQPISAERTLIIISCDTSYGTLSIAVVRDGSLSEADTTLLRNALIAVVESKSDSTSSPQIGAALD